MSFDPSQPYETLPASKPQQGGGFDPSQPYEEVPLEKPRRMYELEANYRAANHLDDPETVASHARLADEAGVSYQIASTIPDDVRKKMQAPDFEQIATNAPRLSEHLNKNTLSLQQLRDDLPAMSGIEKLRSDLTAEETALFSDGGAAHDDSYQAAAMRGVSSMAVMWNQIQASAGGDMPVAPERQQQILAAAQTVATAHGNGTGRPAQDAAISSLGELSNREELIFASGIYSQLPRDRRQEVFVNLINDGRYGDAAKYGGANAGLITTMLTEQAPIMGATAYSGGLLGGGLAKLAAGRVLGGMAPYAVNAAAAVDGAAGVGAYAGSNFFSNAAISYPTALADNIAAGMSTGAAADKAGAQALGEGAGNAAFALVPGFGGKLSRMMLETARQAAGGAVGAYAGNAAVGEKTTAGEMAAEAFFELASAPVDYSSQLAGDHVQRRITEAAAQEDAIRSGMARAKQELDAISSIKILQTNPKTVLQALEAMDGDETQDVYINPDQLFNQGAVPRAVFEQIAPSAAGQIDQALAVGGTIRIPRNELLVGAAQHPDAQEALLRHLQESPNTPSMHEADQRREELSAELYDLADQQIAKSKQANDYREQRDAIEQHLLDSLAAAGQDVEGNKSRARLSASMIMATAAASRSGIAPLGLYKQMGGQVYNEKLAGEQFNQGGKDDAQSQLDEINFFESSGVYTPEEAARLRSEAQKEAGQHADGFDEHGYRITARDELGAFFSNLPASFASHGRKPVGTSRIRKQAHIYTAELGGDARRTREVDQSSLGPFSGYKVGAEVYHFDKTESQGQLEIKYYGKEQIDAGLTDSPALRVYLSKSGELTLNGPEWGSKTFDEFKARGWAEEAKGEGGAEAVGYTRLVSPDGKDGQMPTSQLVAVLADAHARLREWRKEDKVGAYWHRDTGATGGLMGHEGSVFFQDANQPAPRGAFNPLTHDIHLLAAADLSTFLHESGHQYLEIMTKLAIQSPADSPLRKDMDAAFKWFGLKGDSYEERNAAWVAMSVNEKRDFHEKWAESFEQYLFEGKAPSLALRDAFRNFRQWLTHVYKSLSQFLGSHDGAKLNDEMRGIFDRMLATEEQIQEMESARGMVPLFSEKPAHMTDAEWDYYQESAQAATQSAIEQLTSRSLRDMKWLRNAKSKRIRQLQREAASQRREARIEARAQIMSQPIYRAMQFLTAPLEGTQAANKRARNSEQVDTSRDDLLTAIAKLGGLNKDQAESQYGIDPKDFHARKGSIVGKPVLRKTGGLSPDAMSEALSEYGYLPLDENGKWDIQDLEDGLRSEAAGDPQYSDRADYDLLLGGTRRMTAPDAEQVDFVGGRLNRGDISDMFDDIDLANIAGEAYYQKAPKDVTGKRSLESMGVLADDGLHPDMVADLFGLSSGDELVRKLLTAPDPVAEIERLTDEIMLQRHSDLATPAGREAAAEAAVHNEARGKFIATELTMLNRALGKPSLIVKQAKEYAQRIVDATKVRDLKPAQYEASEAKAGKAAEKALISGNQQEAAMQKRNQVLHNMTAKIMRDSAEDVANVRDFYSKIIKASNKKNVTRGRDPDVVNAITAVLAQYGFYPKREQNALQYLALVEQHDKEMAGILKPMVDTATISAKPWQDMTLDEFMGLRAEIESLWYLAKRSRQMEIDGNRIDIEEAASELLGRMEEKSIPETVPGDKSAITPKEAAMRSLQYAGAILRRVEQWAEAKDGKFGGPFLRLIFQPIKEAANSYRRDRVTYRKQYMELIKALPAMKRGVIEAPELGYTFGKGDQKVGLAELLHAVLHTGNASNKRKLLLGRKWAVLREDGSLDTRRWDAFMTRMYREGTIKKEHMDFSQGVWDLLDSMKPLAQKTHREVFGRYFDEVTADAFDTPFGEYRGGYVPAQADPRLTTDAAIRQLAEQENQSMSFSFPSTSKGFTKARVEYNRPLMLDIRSLAQHMDKVLLFAHMEPAVRDVNRLLMRSEVSSNLSRIDPAAYDGLLVPWLNRAARQVVETPILGDGQISRVLSVARNRAGMALMFGNVSNTVQQITGFSTALLKVRPAHMRRAAAQYVRDPKAAAALVASASDFMRDRMENEISAIANTTNEILLDPSLYEKSQAWTQKHAYFMQSAFDNVMGPMVWIGAYNQSVAEGMSERDAIRYADGAVRQTQGTTLPEDVSRIETGPAYARVFTQFIGYFNMLANTNVTELQKVADEAGLKKGAGKALGIVFFGLLMPAWVAEAVATAFKGGVEDDDDDGWYLDDWLAQVIGMGTLKTLLAGVPFAGTLVMSAINRFNDNPMDDRVSLSPAVSLLESGMGAPLSVYKAIANEGDKRKAILDVASLATLATGLPLRAAARPIGYMAGIADDKIDPTSTVDFARGVVTGTPSKESKQR